MKIKISKRLSATRVWTELRFYIETEKLCLPVGYLKVLTPWANALIFILKEGVKSYMDNEVVLEVS